MPINLVPHEKGNHQMMRRQRTSSLQREISIPSPLGPPLPPLPGWLDPPTLSSETSSGFSEPGGPGGAVSSNGKTGGVLISILFQLVFWPLTLGLMLAESGYRFLLRIGCRTSPLYFRDPSRWFVGLASKPFCWVNPPVALGTVMLEQCLRSRTGNGAAIREEQRKEEASESHPCPVLLVGNHNLLGLNCLPLLNEVQGQTGVYPRVLYDTLFGYVPGLKQLIEAAGGVKGTLGNCEALMSEGRCLLLYPGGAREALRGANGDKYKLMWNDKLGFVRLAVKHGYTVVPFASFGLEDAVSIAFNVDASCIARTAEPDRGPLYIPFLLPYNSLERQYFAFGEPIETAHFEGDWENLAKCTEVYIKVKGGVEQLIQKLRQLQEKDPERFLSRRIWRSCCRMLGALGGESDQVPGH